MAKTATYTRYKDNKGFFKVKSKFFKPGEFVIIQHKHNIVQITYPTIDYRGMLHKIMKSDKQGWVKLHTFNEDLETGVYKTAKNEDTYYIIITSD